MKLSDRVLTKVKKLTDIALWKSHAKRQPSPDISILTNSTENSGNGPVFEVRGDCYINPFDGYIICNGHVIWDSMIPNYDPAANVSAIGVPSFKAYREAKAGMCKTIHAPRALHCRHFFEWNYYHFFMDVLSKISVFESARVSMQDPLVVGKYFDQLPFAPQVMNTTSLRRYSWINQHDSFIQADCVRFCRVDSDYKNRVNWINGQVSSSLIDPKDDRIYLTRGKSSGRNVSNERDLVDILTNHDFQVVDTNGLHILEQVEIFKNARHVVAPHGAGLTNIMFRGSTPLSVLELHPIHKYTDFKRICDSFGHSWSSIMGNVEPGDVRHANFSINPHAFESELVKMIA
jgi:hypothetical protein